MYVAINHRPDYRCDIQDTSYGKSKTMIQLKLIDTTTKEGANNIVENNNGMLYCIHIRIELVLPWDNFNHVSTDSYFASVRVSKILKRIGLYFIGVVKTATKRFLMKYLSKLELNIREDIGESVVYGDGSMPLFIALCWMDYDAVTLLHQIVIGCWCSIC